MSALDRQVGGDHYRKLTIQPLHFARVNKMTHVEACVLKYLCRYRYKGDTHKGLEDIAKCAHYLEMVEEDFRIERNAPVPKTMAPPRIDGPPLIWELLVSAAASGASIICGGAVDIDGRPYVLFSAEVPTAAFTFAILRTVPLGTQKFKRSTPPIETARVILKNNDKEQERLARYLGLS